MHFSFESITFKLKAVLCCLLVLNINFWLAGCGGMASLDSTLANALTEAANKGAVRIGITPGQPLAQALADTQFRDVEAVNLFTDTQTFSFVFPDQYRNISGSYVVQDGVFTVTEIRLEAYERWVELKFDGNKRVTSITTSDGSAWTLPKGDSSLEINAYTTNIQAYIDANANLVAAAQEYDRQAGNTGFSLDAYLNGSGGSSGGNSGGGGKPNAALFLPLLMVLTPLAPVFGLLGFLQPLVALFAAVSAMSAMFTVRFDGTWTLASAVMVGVPNVGGIYPPNIIVIKGGRITEMRTAGGAGTQAQGFTWEIVETNLLSAMDRNVQWKVVADLVVQPIPNKITVRVELRWDMTEIPAAPDSRLLNGNIFMDAADVHGEGYAEMHTP